MSVRRARFVVLLVVFAGCTGVGGPTGGSPQEATTTTTTLQSTTTVTTTTVRTATSPTPDGAAVAEYRDLPPEARRAFVWALENGSVRLTGVDGQAMRPLFDHESVRYEGEVYDVRAVRHSSSRHVLVEVQRVDGSVPVGSDVVDYGNLSVAGRDAVRSVLEGTESSVSFHPDAFPLPGGPSQPGYVRHGNETYELTVATGEVWEYRVTVTNSSG